MVPSDPIVKPRGFSRPVATVLHCARSPDGLAAGLPLAASEARVGGATEADAVRLAAGLPPAALCAGRLARPVDGVAVDELVHAAAMSAIAAALMTAARGPTNLRCERVLMDTTPTYLPPP